MARSVIVDTPIDALVVHPQVRQQFDDAAVTRSLPLLTLLPASREQVNAAAFQPVPPTSCASRTSRQSDPHAEIPRPRAARRLLQAKEHLKRMATISRMFAPKQNLVEMVRNVVRTPNGNRVGIVAT